MIIKSNHPTEQLVELKAGDTFHLNGFHYMVLRFNPQSPGFNIVEYHYHVVNLNTNEAFVMSVDTEVNPVKITGHVS